MPRGLWARDERARRSCDVGLYVLMSALCGLCARWEYLDEPEKWVWENETEWSCLKARFVDGLLYTRLVYTFFSKVFRLNCQFCVDIAR